MEAVSLSPFHGLRMAQPQPLLRTKPIHVSIDGIPKNIRRGEILENLTISARNNMPISLQVYIKYIGLAKRKKFDIERKLFDEKKNLLKGCF